MTEFVWQGVPFRSTGTECTALGISAALTHPKQFVATWRLPLLAPATTTQPSHFVGFERGNRVEMDVWARNRNVSRATFDDAPILAFCATKLVRVYDKTLTEVAQVEIEPRKLLQEMGQPAGPRDIDEVINGMRRLHMTQVSVRNWGQRRITASEPLLSVELFEGRYIATLPDFLWDEIAAPRTRVVRIKHEYLTLNGARALLFGWARGFVGKKVGDARQITKGDAIMRAGPFESGKDPWTEIRYAVSANNIPGFDFRITNYKSCPIIEVREILVSNHVQEQSPETLAAMQLDDVVIRVGAEPEPLQPEGFAVMPDIDDVVIRVGAEPEPLQPEGFAAMPDNDDGE